MFTPAESARIARDGDRLTTVLLWIASAAALASCVAACVTVADAADATRVVELWRAAGLGFFAGAFALLASRPLGYPGLWELLIVNKLVLTAAGAVLGSAAGAGELIVGDGLLLCLLIAGYIRCGVWSAAARPRSGRGTAA